MGLILPRKYLISSDIINQNIKENNPNLEFYYRNRLSSERIIIHTFKTEILKEQNDNLVNGILSHFLYRNELNYYDLKYFYTMFNPNDLDIRQGKLKFISELLFNQSNYIEEDKFNENLNLYFSHNNCSQFVNYINHFLTRRNKIQKKGMNIINKDELLNTMKRENNSALINIINKMIVKKIVPSSLVKRNNNGKLNYKNYFCDCVKHKTQDEKVKKGIEEKYKELYMEKLLKYSKDLTPEELIEKLKKYKINKFFLKSLILYFKKKTLKNTINKLNFVELLYRICLAKKEEERIELSFEILSFPNTKEISGKTIEEIFENEKEKPKIKQLSKEDYIQIFSNSVDSNILTDFIKSIPNCFDKLNLYPYISGDEIAFEKNIIKNILEFYKEGKNFDQLCKEKLLNERYFFAVDSTFINNIDNYLNGEMEEKPIIDTQKICNKNKGSTNLLQKDLIYENDFYIVPNIIYNFFKKYFTILGDDIVLNRIIYNENNEINLTKDENEKYHPGQKEIKIKYNNEIYEIEFYPIHIKVYQAKELYEYLKDESYNKSQIADMNEFIHLLNKIYKTNVRTRRSYIVSRKEIIDKILEKINESNLINPNVFFYTEFNFHKANFNTYEEERLYEFCILIIDSQFNDNCSYIKQIQLYENEEFVKEEEKKKLELKKKEEKEK